MQESINTTLEDATMEAEMITRQSQGSSVKQHLKMRQLTDDVWWWVEKAQQSDMVCACELNNRTILAKERTPHPKALLIH